jgi:predicted permease
MEMSWWSRLVNVWRTAQVDRDLDDEQRFHIESRADDLEAQGVSRREAIAQASRQFGGRLRLREASRDIKLLSRVESLARDGRFGLRLLRRDAVISAAAVLSLGLAIGACTAAFSLIDALILRELPVRDPHGLAYMSRTGQGYDPRFSTLASYPFFERARQALAPHMEVFSLSHQSLRQAMLPDSPGTEEKLQTQFVSGNAFAALGVRATRGRLLAPSDDVTPGGHPVAVISHALWTRRFGQNPAAIGQWLWIDPQSYQIVGIAQAGFTGAHPGILTDVWLPNRMFHRDTFTAPNWNWLQVWGRLAPTATRERLQPIVATTLANFEAEQRGGKPGARQQTAVSGVELVDAATGYSAVRHQFDRPLLVLAGIIGVVLLIACSNVANLLLARGAARRREMALRASIGAGRGRLVQQVLVESAVLTLAATVLGVLCAVLAVPLMVGMLTTNENPVYLDARLSWRALLFVAALGSVTTVLFGLAPALRASAAAPATVAGLGSRGDTARTGAARSLVAAQIGFSLMILFVAALLLRSFDRLLAVDLGFTADRLTLLSVEARDRFEPPRAREVGRRLLQRVQEMPGVESASLSAWALFRGWSNANNFELPGGARAQTFRLDVSPQFFRTMETRMLDGREFEPRDGDAAGPVPVIVNDTFARRYFAGERAVGRRMATERGGRRTTYEIVGMAANVRDGSVRGDIGPYVFSPIGDAGGTLEIRSSLEPRVLADLVRQELPMVHASLRLVDITDQRSLVGNTLLRERLLAVLSGFFASLGLVLAAVGLYGVLSYAVVQRTREIGIRLTLGAQPSAVVRSVLGRVALAVAIGIAGGLGGGVYFARFVRALLFEVEPLSLSSVALPVLGLLAVSLVAAWRPARCATRVDPAEALRME